MQSAQTAQSSIGQAPGQLLLSLRARPGEASKSENVPFLIARINAQRGSFRNITESSLAQEAETVDVSHPGEGNDDAKSPAPESTDGRPTTEDMFKARGEIAQVVGQAMTQTTLSLEFISLLLSQYTPRQAESTISLGLKQVVPLGSLGAERIQAAKPSVAKQKDEDLTILGWKLQALNNTANSLLSSAARLESEMEKETKYWEQVLAVKEQGWSLSRLPREKHTLGVHYGFAEASREFSDRGLAALRRQDDGTINLDLGLRASSNTLRVRLQSKGKTTASSSIRREASMDALEPLTRAILQARNEIFDEELFHELYREARTLTNRGVRCTSATIVIPSKPDAQILIDVVPVETSEDESPSGSKTDVEFVNILANAFRILLSHAHRQNLKRRCQPPAPLTEKPPQRPNYFMLRPVLDYLYHKPASLRVSKLLKELGTTLQQAKLSLLVDDSGVSAGLTNAFAQLLQRPTQVAEALVELLSRAMFHIHKLTLPSGKQTTLHVRTGHMGVEYKVAEEADGTKAARGLKENQFQSFEAMKRHLQMMVRRDLLSLIESGVDGGAWRMSSPLSGELSLDRGFQFQAQVLLLNLDDGGLSMAWDGRDNSKEKDGKFVWGGVESTASEPRGILDVAKSIAQGFTTKL